MPLLFAAAEAQAGLPNYGWPPATWGLAYIVVGVSSGPSISLTRLGAGFFSAAGTAAVYQNRIYAIMAKKKGGEQRPEYRLVLTTIGGIILPFGMLIFGPLRLSAVADARRVDRQRSSTSHRPDRRDQRGLVRHDAFLQLRCDIHRCASWLAVDRSLESETAPRHPLGSLSPADDTQSMRQCPTLPLPSLRPRSCVTSSARRYLWRRRPCGGRSAGAGAAHCSHWHRYQSCQYRWRCSVTDRRCANAGHSCRDGLQSVCTVH